jgi:DNA modification methylase
MGSGTTGVVCVNENRKFIGIEMDDKYYEIAKNRVEKALKEKNKPNLFNL